MYSGLKIEIGASPDGTGEAEALTEPDLVVAFC